MRCSKALKYMERQLGNELSQSHVSALEAHLKRCSACREQLALNARLRNILSPSQQPEFPTWLHHQILSQAASHDSKRHALQQRWKLRLVPAMLALILSLSIGVTLGRVAYNTANPYPSLNGEIAQNLDEGMEIASFGEGIMSSLERASGSEQ